MHPAVSLTITLFMTLMIGMPLVGLLVSGRHQEDRAARIWFLAIVLDSLQIPLVAAKSTFPSWWTIALPGVIPVMFFITLSNVLRSELKQTKPRIFGPIALAGALYLAAISVIFKAIPDPELPVQAVNNLLFLGFSALLAVQSFFLARKTASRGMYFVSLGFAVSLLGYGARAWWHLVYGVSTHAFDFGPVGNFQIWTVVLNLTLMTFGYLGYVLEKAQKQRLEFATKAAEAVVRQEVAEQYNQELLTVIAERDHMVMENSRFLNFSALAVFNSAIVHEISQPIQAALMCLENVQARDECSGCEIEQAVGDAIRLTSKAGEVVSVLRRMMQQGHDQIQPINVSSLLVEILPIVEGDAKNRGVGLECELPSLPFYCQCNGVMLQRLILNLVANAFDAFKIANTASPKLLIKGEVANDPSNPLRTGLLLSVVDNGPGVKTSELEKMFEPFATSKSSGLGVGLSLAQILLRKWSGSIKATLNSPDTGLTFQIWLPKA